MVAVDSIFEAYSEFESIEDGLPGLTALTAFRKAISAIYDMHGDDSFERIYFLVQTIYSIKCFIDEEIDLSEIKKKIEIEDARKKDHKDAQELLRQAALLMGLDKNHFIFIRSDIRKKEQAETKLRLGQRTPHIEGESTNDYKRREGFAFGGWSSFFYSIYASYSASKGGAANINGAANGMAVRMLFSCLPFDRLNEPYKDATSILAYCGYDIKGDSVKNIAKRAGYVMSKQKIIPPNPNRTKPLSLQEKINRRVSQNKERER